MAQNQNPIGTDVQMNLTSFKAGTAEINRSIKVVESSFKAAAAGMDNWSQSAEGLQARIKTLDTVTDLQRKKVEALTAEYKKIAAEKGANSKEAQDLEIWVNKETAALNKNEKELRQCKESLDKLGNEANQAAAAEDKAGKEAQQMGTQIKNAGDKSKEGGGKIGSFASSTVMQFASVAGATRILKEIFSQLWEKISEAAAAADDLITLSNQTGINTKKLQEFGYMSALIDVETETYTGSLKKLSKAMYDASIGTKMQKDAFSELGVAYDDGNGNLRNNEEVFYDLIDALGSMTDETKRDALSMVLMGKSAQELNPLILAGKDKLKAYKNEAYETGAILDDVTVAALGRLQDSMDTTAYVVDAEGKKIVARLAPIAEKYNEIQEQMKNFVPLAIDTMEKMATQNSLTFKEPLKALDDMTFAFNNMNFAILGLGRPLDELKAKQKELTEESVKSFDEMNLAVYASGLSFDEFKLKQEELAAFLITQGTAAANSENEAMTLLAQGIDTAAYAAQQATKAQQEFDTAIATATDNYIAKSEEYAAAVETNTQKYLGQMGGLFDAFKINFTNSRETLDAAKESILGNLADQVTGFKLFTGELNQFAEKTSSTGKKIPEEMVAELKNLGPDALPQIQALNDMSGDELDKLIALYGEKTALATAAAEAELKPMKDDAAAAMNEVIAAIDAKEAGMAEVGRKLGAAFKKELLAQMSDAEKRARSILNMPNQVSNVAATQAANYNPLPKYGEGGVVNFPHVAWVGDEEEVIVPLKQSARSLQLLNYASARMGQAAQGIASGADGIAGQGYQSGKTNITNYTIEGNTYNSPKALGLRETMLEDRLRDQRINSMTG
jgi:hypothetical protein